MPLPKNLRLPPYPVVRVLDAFRAFLIRLNRRLFPGNVVLYEQFQYFWLLPSLYVAAKLDIAGLLAEKPMTSREMADRLGADPLNLERLLRALSSQGIFKVKNDGKYRLTPMASGLTDGPGSLRNMILHHLGPVNWNLMSNLEYAVMTGKDAFHSLYGRNTYEYLADHPEEFALFDRSMSNLSELGLAPILNAFDFSKFPVIADIGGGEGFLLANILKYNPHCRGILFDSERAAQKSGPLFERHGVSGRTQAIQGDFFQEVPTGADLYILKNILHNWSDESATEILSTLFRSSKNAATVLIIEMVVPQRNLPSMSKLLDIQMMATMSGGRERTEAEYARLCKNAGFRLRRIVPTISPVALLEAVKPG